MKHDPGFVYFLHAEGTDRYKIGKSIDVERRLRELNGRQSAFNIELMWSIDVADMSSAESWLHDRFSSRRTHGEWFRFDSDELSEVEQAYLEADAEFSHQPEPQHQQYQPAYSPSYAPDFSVSWELIVGIIAIVGAGIFAVSNQGKSATVLQYSNVRKTPNGQILCTVQRGTQVKVKPTENSQWFATDVCKEGSGVIFKTQFRESDR